MAIICCVSQVARSNENVALGELSTDFALLVPDKDTFDTVDRNVRIFFTEEKYGKWVAFSK